MYFTFIFVHFTIAELAGDLSLQDTVAEIIFLITGIAKVGKIKKNIYEKLR